MNFMPQIVEMAGKHLVDRCKEQGIEVMYAQIDGPVLKFRVYSDVVGHLEERMEAIMEEVYKILNMGLA